MPGHELERGREWAGHVHLWTWKLVVNLASRLLLLGVKLAAFFYTGFLVLLGEALNSLVDIVVTGSLLVGSWVSQRAGDREHPFGHLRLRNVISLIVAVTFITVTSFQILREAIARLLEPVPLEHPEVAFWVLGFSFLVNLVPIGLILAGGRGRGEITLKTALYDNINDELTIIASLVGVYLVSRGFYLGDPIAAIVVALTIAAGAFSLIRENTKMLLGRSPEEGFYAEVKRLASSVEGVRGVHGMIAEYIGPGVIHLDLDIELPPDTPISEADKIVEKVISRLRELGVISCRVHPCARQGEERKIHDDLP